MATEIVIDKKKTKLEMVAQKTSKKRNNISSFVNQNNHIRTKDIISKGLATMMLVSLVGGEYASDKLLLIYNY